MTPAFHADQGAIEIGTIRLEKLSPIIDGMVIEGRPETRRNDATVQMVWSMADGETFELALEDKDGGGLAGTFRLTGFDGDKRLQSLGLVFGRARNVQRYLRNGYMSWDGSYFVEPDQAREVAKADPAILSGHAATALVSRQGDVAVVGFTRHDRFQSRLAFDFSGGALSFTLETLVDGVPRRGGVEGEPFILLAASSCEEGMREWARAVAAASPIPPRLQEKRLTGWCSWYNLYASLSPDVLTEHLEAAKRYRQASGAPFDIFLIDDGFTPEMGDWLETRPQFLSGMQPILEEISAAGFIPGLWIAPFMVGNRSKLYAEHPDWVVKDRKTGKPLAPMTFYGEFRWHKRSEEYYVLDVTHPDAEAYIRSVFRTWRQEWGCRYFKADFLHLGSTYGPDVARWHRDDLSRMEIWMIMARLMREEIGDASLLLCGSPLWAPVGLTDAVRIGRDIGVTWQGHYSAESLLRDQTSRNFGNGILWQADPDCILLRDRFHDLTESQVRSLALFAGLAGGVLMTSDQLDEVPADRRELLTRLLEDGKPFACDFPLAGTLSLTHGLGTAPSGKPVMTTTADPVIVQRVHRQTETLLNIFNTGEQATDRLIPWGLAGQDTACAVYENDKRLETMAQGVQLTLAPYQSRLLSFRTAS
ncbi:glycoside hydrolase family 36 protein [Rhizobium sp. RU36D]|uniref:glycoside hydrolase family 36 protein n=1 Tax=Rhizobium sp. RU36D TaxID=1907415 RepID=UPI0009D8CFF6|nr:glycoside hydrolase family 36 protein [Rhizobium sp. RU36D]SMC54348.1 Melibiase [Rhizobium sp. RU36D]